MSRSLAVLWVPEGVILEDIASRLSPRYRLQEQPPISRERVFLDSFDWRVHRSGRVLEHLREGERGELVWRRPDGGGRRLRLPADSAPAFARELAASPLRGALLRVLEIRRLLPLVRVRGQVRRLCLRDTGDRTVLRLELEQGHFLSAVGEPRAAADGRLCLLPVRGCGADLERAARALRGLLPPPRQDLYQAALQAVGRVPGDYVSRPKLRLAPVQPAGQAARQIHRALLWVIEANLEGARAGLDPEFLHDLRVATRRTRSALGQLRALFSAPEVAHFKAEFAWLQQITGPTRDLDVQLLTLDGYRAALPPELRADLQPLEAFLTRHQAATQAALARELDSARLHGLLADWRAFLEAPGPIAAADRNAARPLREVADARLRRLHRRVLEEGRAISDTAPAETLHELRKSCKKLRYLLEFFHSLYPSRQVRRMLKRLKGLLDNLGGIQDSVVQMRTLREMGERMSAAGEGGPATLLALGALLADLGGRQRAERERFAQVFTAFDSAEERRLFKDLLRTRGAADPP